MKLEKEKIAKIKSLRREGKQVKDISKIIGIPYSSVYNCIRLPERGYSSRHEYLRKLAEDKGISIYEYFKKSARRRIGKKENRELSLLITTRLAEMRKTQRWLAEQAGVSHQAITLYKKGENCPREEVLEKIYSALNS